MSDYPISLIKKIAEKISNLPGFSSMEIEKYCWMAAHEHKNGVLPSEYDIREIDETLYLQLLKEFKSKYT